MKKIKSLFCVGILSILLVGNVFASTTLTSSVTTFMESIMEYLTSFSDRDDNCPLRICQETCKPNTNCRPIG